MDAAATTAPDTAVAAVAAVADVAAVATAANSKLIEFVSAEKPLVRSRLSRWDWRVWCPHHCISCATPVVCGVGVVFIELVYNSFCSVLL